MMFTGAGMFAPLSCLRRFAGNAGRFAANDGVDGVPPGILYFLSVSHGCPIGSPDAAFSAIHRFAAGMRSSALRTISSTSPSSLASAGLKRFMPCSRTCISALAMPIIRTVRVTPPAPGKQPEVDLREADDGLRVVDDDAVMRRQRDLQAAAERRTVDRRDHRDAERLDRAQLRLGLAQEVAELAARSPCSRA